MESIAGELYRMNAAETDESNALLCFKNGAYCRCRQRSPVGVVHILEQANRGNTKCRACGEPVDLHEGSVVSGFGTVEALFGLQRLMFIKDIPASQHPQCIVVDPMPQIPPDWVLVYAHMSPVSLGEFSFSELPRLLAPQNMHQPWSPHLMVYVPAGDVRQINFSLVLRPPDIERVRTLALQACENLHRSQLGIATVLLCAAAEQALRERLSQVYQARGVRLDEKAGFHALLERARMLLVPELGPKIVGALNALAKEGRNPTAHGRSATLEHDQVSSWMVDLAVLYEWTIHADER